jgi:RNA polymerase sigma-70 factor, ECF subfamily
MGKSESERRQRFDAVFEFCGPDVVAYCSWRAGSENDAQDAAAEVFLTAWRRLDELPEGDATRGGSTRPPAG